MHYRRALIPCSTYFFTVALAKRKSTLLIEHADELRDPIRVVKLRNPFEIVAMVVSVAAGRCGLSDALVAH
jgi:putative transposase